MLEIEINNQQTRHRIDKKRLVGAARLILVGEGIETATLSLAVVDDPTIHELNRKYLQHDYPTDVLSFVLDRNGAHLDGEVIVSADTAASLAADYDWPAADELLLYVIHGVLHLTGYDDKSPAKRAKMRERETHYLQQLGVQRRSEK